MKADDYALFETAIGDCAVAWNVYGIVGVQLPEGDVVSASARMARRFPGASKGEAPPEISAAIDAIVALLEGDEADLSGLQLDLSQTPAFEARVYAGARAIPRGQTRTYGQVATSVGEPGAARAVGQAMGRNPFPIIVPCHRVVAADGRLGGFSAHGGAATKIRLLEIERATVGEEPALFGDLPLAIGPVRAR